MRKYLCASLLIDEPTGQYIASLRNHGQIFLASYRRSGLARLLRHRNVLQKERSHDDSPAENEYRYEAMLDSKGERELERRAHLVEQAMRPLHRLCCHRSSDLVVLRAGRHVRDSTLGRKALCRSYHRSAISRIDEYLRVSRDRQSGRCELMCDGSRNTARDIAGKGIIHHGSNDGYAHHRAKLAEVPYRAGANSQAYARQRILCGKRQHEEEWAYANARNHHEYDRFQQTCRWRHT